MATRAVVVSMTDDQPTPTLDPDDALEAKLQLGVLASRLMELAHILSLEAHLLAMQGTGRVIDNYIKDAQVLTAAMEVLERRSAPVIIGR